MRLTWKRDGLASLFVVVAAAIYAVWVTETGLTGMSTRALGAAVFVLGWAACTSNKAEMAIVYGADRARGRPSMPYVVAASLLGAVAFVAGIIALVSANEAMLATLVIATGALWVIATLRHAFAPDAEAGDEIPAPLAKAT
jgi:hypothetical protein